jgi:hypothetical protein
MRLHFLYDNGLYLDFAATSRSGRNAATIQGELRQVGTARHQLPCRIDRVPEHHCCVYWASSLFEMALVAAVVCDGLDFSCC